MSRRATEAYFRSGVQLESSCGMSDIWYNYVESNAKLFKPTSSMAIPPGTSVLSCPPIFSPSQSSPHPRLNSKQLQSIQKNLGWYMAHSRPRPTKKPTRVPENTHNVHAEGSPPIDTTLEFSTALEYYNNLLAEANSCNSKAREQVIGHTVVGKEEQKGKGLTLAHEVRVEAAFGSLKAVPQQEDANMSSDDYQFDEDWSTPSSFSTALTVLLNQADLQASRMVAPSIIVPLGTSGVHCPDEMAEATKDHTDTVGTSGKCYPILTLFSQWLQ